MAPTPTYRLADLQLSGGLEEYVRSRRVAGRSWRRIALDLLDDIDLDVTHETLRSWFPEDPADDGSQGAA